MFRIKYLDFSLLDDGLLTKMSALNFLKDRTGK